MTGFLLGRSTTLGALPDETARRGSPRELLDELIPDPRTRTPATSSSSPSAAADPDLAHTAPGPAPEDEAPIEDPVIPDAPERVARIAIVRRYLAEVDASAAVDGATDAMRELRIYLSNYRPDEPIYTLLRARLERTNHPPHVRALVGMLNSDFSPASKALFRRMLLEGRTKALRQIGAREFAKRATAADTDDLREWVGGRGTEAARFRWAQKLAKDDAINRQLFRALARRTGDPAGNRIATRFLRLDTPGERALVVDLTSAADPLTRRTALHRLARLAEGDASIRAVLVERLRSDPEPGVRGAMLTHAVAWLRTDRARYPDVERAVRAAVTDAAPVNARRAKRFVRTLDRDW